MQILISDYKELVNTLNEAFEIINNYSKYDSAILNKAIDEQKRVLSAFLNSPDLILALYNDKETFNKLNPKGQIILAAECSVLMKVMLQNGELEKLDSKFLSKLIASYIINVSTTYRGAGIFVAQWHAKNNASEAEREQICLDFAKQKVLVDKINSAARIFLFSFLKKSKLFQQNLKNLDKNLCKSIFSAYDIRTDYNPEVEMWDKYLWPSLVGFGIGDCIGRISELINCAIYETPQYTTAKDDPKAAAEVLISHPLLSKKLSQEHRFYSDNIRLKLAEKYSHITRLLILNPSYRGNEVSLDDLELLVERHNLHDVYQLQIAKEENQKLQDQIKNLEEKLKQQSFTQEKDTSKNQASLLIKHNTIYTKEYENETETDAHAESIEKVTNKK